MNSMLYFWDEEKFNKFNEEMKIIEKWNKRLQLNWLRKQRDGIIGYLQEKINKLNITKPILSKQIKHLKHVAKELTELNDEIYDIEINLHSKESVYSGPSSETKKLQVITENKSDSESDSKSDSKSDSESDSESDNDLFIHTKCGGIIKKSDPRIQSTTKKLNESENKHIEKIPKLKPGMVVGKHKYIGLCDSPRENDLIFDEKDETFQINKKALS